MGNEKSKAKYSPTLSPEQKDSIRKMLNIGKADKSFSVTQDLLQKLWKDKLSDGLYLTFMNYLFRSSKTTTVEELEKFFYHMVEAPFDERAKTVISLLSPDITIHTFVSDLLESYMKILEKASADAYSSWARSGAAQKAGVGVVAEFLVKEMDDKLSAEILERWLYENGFVKDIMETVVKMAFGTDTDELRPALPKADKPSSLLHIPSVLAFSHFIRDTSKNWRLLFSSSEEAHSWNILQQKLFGQGPTLVLVRDGGGHLFGGYASQSWKLCPNFYGDENCFLFQLSPEMLICQPTGYNANYQYMNSNAATLPNGLGMGGQLNYFGLWLSSEFGPASVAKSCTTFKDYKPLASEMEFTFSQLEIWAVGEPDAVEENVRKVYVGPAGLAMDKDPTAAAILEMAGKGGYSKNLPPEITEDEQTGPP